MTQISYKSVRREMTEITFFNAKAKQHHTRSYQVRPFLTHTTLPDRAPPPRTSPRIPPAPTRASAGAPSPPELGLLRDTGELAAMGCTGARLRLRSELERLFLRTASRGSAMSGAARRRRGAVTAAAGHGEKPPARPKEARPPWRERGLPATTRRGHT